MKIKPVRLLVLVMVALCLTGCAFSDPRIEGTPPGFPLDQPFLDQTTSAAEELRTAWALATTLGAAHDDAQAWENLTDTLRAQWLVLVGPDPLNRLPSLKADIGAPAPPTDNLFSATDAALADARDQNLSRASQATGLEAGFWASLACGIEQVRRGIGHQYPSPTPGDLGSTLVILDESEAREVLLLRYHEAEFALEAALGFVQVADPARSSLLAILSTVRKDMAGLTALVDSPLPFPGIYELPEGRDPLALLASVQKALVGASAVWVASSTDPSVAIEYMLRNSTLGIDMGIGVAHWPGWPD